MTSSTCAIAAERYIQNLFPVGQIHIISTVYRLYRPPLLQRLYIFHYLLLCHIYTAETSLIYTSVSVYTHILYKHELLHQFVSFLSDKYKSSSSFLLALFVLLVFEEIVVLSIFPLKLKKLIFAVVKNDNKSITVYILLFVICCQVANDKDLGEEHTKSTNCFLAEQYKHKVTGHLCMSSLLVQKRRAHRKTNKQKGCFVPLLKQTNYTDCTVMGILL